MNIEFAFEHGLNILLQNSLNRLIYEYGDGIYECIQDSEQLKTEVLHLKSYVETKGIKCNFERLFTRKYVIEYETYLIRLLNSYTDIYLFGNGMVSNALMTKFIDVKGYHNKIKGIIVSSKKSCDNHNIIDIQHYSKVKNKGLLIVAVNATYIGEVVQLLHKEGIDNFEILNTLFQVDICNE